MKHRSRTQGLDYDTAATRKVARVALLAAITLIILAAPAGCTDGPTQIALDR